ncbi:uncharacterized protein LOC134279037 [Saccostrea cucullata]|uniref:uncharacterized protein LOC134279037 n=1 Tax=Saccostrea cuccullata TaxID=36930 RepID=UPI002ED0FAE1
MVSVNLLSLMSLIYIVECQKPIKLDSYHSLISHMEEGADISFFFNTASCAPSSVSNTASLISSSEYFPVFGGELKLFISINTSNEKTGQTFFSQVRFIDQKPNVLNEEIETIWIANDTAFIFWGKPGFFVNNTADIDLVACSWTKGEGNIWMKQNREQKHLTSFNDIKAVLTSGEKVRWIVNGGCKCPPDVDVCGDGSIGDTIRDFKIMTDGSLSFSTSMTIHAFLSWRYTRIIVFGHVYDNNTANLTISYLDPTTWDDTEDHVISCPIASENSTEGANFFYC